MRATVYESLFASHYEFVFCDSVMAALGAAAGTSRSGSQAPLLCCQAWPEEGRSTARCTPYTCFCGVAGKRIVDTSSVGAEQLEGDALVIMSYLDACPS